MKAVVKKKRLLPSKRHKRNHLYFALAHKDWTLDDWKRVIWSDELKLIVWGQMEGNGFGKMPEIANRTAPDKNQYH